MCQFKQGGLIVDDFSVTSVDVSSKRGQRNMKEVELRRSIEEHVERKRFLAEFGEIMDL